MSESERLNTATFAKGLEAIATQSIHFYRGLLERSEIDPGQIDRATFSLILRFALFCGMTTNRFLDRWGLTPELFARWVAGDDMPKSFIRGEIIAFIKQQLAEPMAAAA
ncbi:MAG: hypothetical protein AB202_02275 [Parcubacteria bacterium C7867-007]|nr:MAG: hypothetical protein AB202_02275 [Parcubacteria bacterium C7867-007]